MNIDSPCATPESVRTRPTSETSPPVAASGVGNSDKATPGAAARTSSASSGEIGRSNSAETTLQ